jgi:hypothetical protein
MDLRGNKEVMEDEKKSADRNREQNPDCWTVTILTELPLLDSVQSKD